ncbi:MAG: hypothetical protein ABI026_05650 [Gemmatimonadaceae bacterium]
MILRDGTLILVAAIVFIGFPVARAYGRRIEKAARDPRMLSVGEMADARLERVERAVEAMALEIERMSEGQRFMTRLLGEKSRDKSVEGGSPRL